MDQIDYSREKCVERNKGRGCSPAGVEPASSVTNPGGGVPTQQTKRSTTDTSGDDLRKQSRLLKSNVLLMLSFRGLDGNSAYI